jgi:hypothetical protein
MYAMRRANGDWFALEDEGCLRVPVFRSSGDAMTARWRHPGMLLFKPVALDEHALIDLAPTAEAVTGFWLVDNPAASLRLSPTIEHTQLALLIQEANP